MKSSRTITVSVFVVFAALQSANSHASNHSSGRPCRQVSFPGRITKKLFAEGTKEVVGLIVKLDDGTTADVQIPKYNDFAVYAGVEAELRRLIKSGPNVRFRAPQCDDSTSQPMRLLDLAAQ